VIATWHHAHTGEKAYYPAGSLLVVAFRPQPYREFRR
jgi:hypothetical protein